MGEAIHLLFALGGIGLFVASTLALIAIEIVVVRRLHRDHRSTWEALGRPGVPFAWLSGEVWRASSRQRLQGALWRWAWRTPDEVRNDATVQRLVRAYVALSLLGLLAMLPMLILIFSASGN